MIRTCATLVHSQRAVKVMLLIIAKRPWSFTPSHRTDTSRAHCHYGVKFKYCSIIVVIIIIIIIIIWEGDLVVSEKSIHTPRYHHYHYYHYHRYHHCRHTSDVEQILHFVMPNVREMRACCRLHPRCCKMYLTKAWTSNPRPLGNDSWTPNPRPLGNDSWTQILDP